ncbi:hypothetical protein [Ferroacidibacillus organovorans]|uniref:hypothetical protein n=1 Tax=Ferroacidibacillus organovorans TaxID=1765683 RepID=UPI00128EADBB|nr:hypothetical protein [Ferroacidibacillus organovorans]
MKRLTSVTRRDFRVLVSTLMIGIILGSTTVALAATVNGNWFYYGPVNGYYYQNQATVVTPSTGGVYAGTWVQNQNSGNVPAGYMGAFSRLYTSNGVQVENSSWNYNSTAAYEIGQNTPFDYTNGTYYSVGATAAYNGNGYTTYQTYQSPDLTY